MRTIYVITGVLLLCGTFAVCAAPGAAGTGGKPTAPPKYTRLIITESLGKLEEAFKEKNGLKLKITDVVGYCDTFDKYAKFPELEKETRISREWFIKIAKQLHGMIEIKGAMEGAEENLNNDLYAKYAAVYQKLIDGLNQTLKNPEKLKR